MPSEKLMIVRQGSSAILSFESSNEVGNIMLVTLTRCDRASYSAFFAPSDMMTAPSYPQGTAFSVSPSAE